MSKLISLVLVMVVLTTIATAEPNQTEATEMQQDVNSVSVAESQQVNEMMTKKDVIMLVLQGITVIIVSLSWYFVPLFTQKRRKEAEVGIWRHTTMSDAHEKLLANFYKTEQYLDELILKYNCDVNDLNSKMNDEELNKLNCFTQEANTYLAMMYIVMPDNKYKAVRDTLIPNQPTTLRGQRENMMLAMRKSQFPDTKFCELKDIRFIHTMKRPGK